MTESPVLQPNTIIKAPLIIGVSLVLGLCLDYFFYYDKNIGLNFPAYIALIVIGLFIISSESNRVIDKQTLWLLVPLAFFSSMVFVRSSDLLTFLNVIGSLSILLLIARISFKEKLRTLLLVDYARIPFLPFRFIAPFFRVIFDTLTLFSSQRKLKTFLQIIKGITVAIPCLLIFLVLFSSADIVFKEYIMDIIHISISFDPDTVAKLIRILVVTATFAGAYSYIFNKNKLGDESIKEDDKKYNFGHIETSILLGTVNILFFVFVLIQLTYIFGDGSNITSQGFTYAEYARTGFFQLIAAAIFSLLLLLGAERYTVRQDTGHTSAFKILSTAMIVQMVLIMISAFKRLLLYEEAYGFTTLRLYSHMFILFLAVIFGLLLYKIFKNKKESTFAFRSFITAIIFLVIMNILNPDLFIARRNIERFASTAKLDTEYMASLSDDAIPETVKIFDISDKDLKRDFTESLFSNRKRQYSSGKSKTSFEWQSFNLSNRRANNILDKR